MPFTLDAEVGSFSVAGQSVDLRKGKQLLVGAGSFSVYSQSVDLRKGRQLLVENGSFTVAGQSVGFKWLQRVGVGVFSVSGKDVNFISPSSVLYATIVNSRVTAISTGSFPASNDAVLYMDLTGVSPTPVVGDYFSDVCQTFSSTPPVIPAGDVAPPYTPGGTPPTVGDPNYPQDEDPDPVDYRSPVLPDLLTWAADATGLLTIPAVPEAETPVGSQYEIAYDFTEVCYMRLQARVITPASSGAVLKLQYFDTVTSSWVDLKYVEPPPP